MESFVEFCQEATYCMRYPQEDSAGWFLWVILGFIVLFSVGAFVGNWKIRQQVWSALKEPTEYRGRLGRDEFLNVYFCLQLLRVCVLVGTIVWVAIFGRSLVTGSICLGSFMLLSWFSVALYSTVVRRGHDFAFDGTEALAAYFAHVFFRFMRGIVFTDRQHTWSVLCEQKGNPYANKFGSAPEENNYLIPPEKDWKSENREFPNVWDEADWKSMKMHGRNTYQRRYWKPEDK